MESAETLPSALVRLFGAGRGPTTPSGGALNDPLGPTIALNFDLFAAARNNGNLLEINPFTQQQVAVNLVGSAGSPRGSGALFGSTATPAGVSFVDDATNTFNLFH